MSSVIRPSGPLPSRVYWMRRLVLVVVLALVVGALWWVLSGLGRAQQPSSAPQGRSVSDPGQSSSPGLGGPTTTGPTSSSTGPGVSPSRDPGQTSAPRSGPPPASTQHQPGTKSDGRHSGAVRPAHTQAPPLAPPTGVCAPADVGMRIEAADAKAGQPTSARLQLTSLATAACTLQITPDTLVIQITSGSDVVWSSADCPDLLPARRVVVRADPATAYEFTWDGRRSVQGCVARGSTAKPGGYWVEAAFVGADVHKAYFDVLG